ncbi:MAG: hypothetical protein CVT67_05310 [Actinobacteria bacterium HGW-Actinobacteria-7]|nr:MAG: hypothetical protein CVT67_05310 [Actinobacteria bacterium HGW-Actinobacteria-7]
MLDGQAIPENAEVAVDAAIVQRNAFVFCRYSVAIFVWAALLMHSAWVLGAVFAILALSAALKVQNSPMVRLYTGTLGRYVPSDEVILGVKAMRFAHSAGAAMALAALALAAADSPFAWPFVAVFAVLKTTSALGFCPAYKLYGCVAKGGCCAMTGKR